MTANTSSSPTEELDSESEESGDAPDGKDKDSKVKQLSPEAIQELIESRDSAKAQKRRMQEEFDSYKSETSKQLKEFKEKLKAIEDEKKAKVVADAESSGDTQKLRESFELQKGELTSQVETLSQQLEAAQREVESLRNEHKRESLKRQALSAMTKVSQDPEVALFLFDLDNEFEEVEDKHGNRSLRVKDSMDDPHVYMKRKLERMQKPHLLLNERKGGTGAQPPASTGTTDQILTREQVDALPDRGAEYFRKNPKAAEAYFRGGKK